MAVGTLAPDFTLELANGDPVSVSQLWRDDHLFLWFSRGLVCPFCRRQMVQLAKIYDDLRRRQTQVVQITPTKLDTARRMIGYFPVVWPYVSDASGEIAEAYEMEPEAGPVGKLGLGLKEQTRAWSILIKTPGEPHPEILPDARAEGALPSRDGGIALVDRTGRVRFKLPTGKLSLLPSNEQILSIVKQLVEGGEV